MKPPSGRLVHRRHTALGPVEVRDDNNRRWMHFGSDAVQTAMALDDPARLIAPYARRMMALLLFHDAPRNVLLLGLGAGALARFIACHFPRAHITALEVNPEVLDVAQTYFGLPDSPRFEPRLGDGIDYVSRVRGVDVLLIDLFDARNMPVGVRDHRFFEQCRRALSPDGVAALNLLAADEREFAAVLAGFRAAFAGRCLYLPVPGYRNVVVLGFAEPPEHRSRGVLAARARILDERLCLELGVAVLSLFRNNPSKQDQLEL